MDTSVTEQNGASHELEVAAPAGQMTAERRLRRKGLGQFFTPRSVAQSLVSWVVRSPRDQLLDPSCGDGEFLRWHKRAVGIEVDVENACLARRNAPSALVHGGDFFLWASATRERFDAVAGNPPFIRYQAFTGEVRQRALTLASKMGANFSALTSSWAPFILVAAGLLRPGGRMAFVVPAEIGHARYARALIPALCARFSRVHIIACQEKLFPELSEDCWLLHCEGAEGSTDEIVLTAVEQFQPAGTPPPDTWKISLADWRMAGERLRPFLLGRTIWRLYRTLVRDERVSRFGALASINIGYVTGANDFFHLRPSEAQRRGIPGQLLRPAIRKGDQLPISYVSQKHVNQWLSGDSQILLLDLNQVRSLPQAVVRYLDEAAGQAARASYKCRNRDPWYAVPDVKVPDAFLTVMAGTRPSLVRNEARCVCSNSIHAVRYKPGVDRAVVEQGWNSALARLGAEVEGHPLGGGMLKIEPREAGNVPIPMAPLTLTPSEASILEEGVMAMRSWRHNAEIATRPRQATLFTP